MCMRGGRRGWVFEWNGFRWLDMHRVSEMEFVGCVDLGCARDPVISVFEHRARRRDHHYDIHLSYACG